MAIVIYATQRGSEGTTGRTYYSLEKPEFFSGFSAYINVSEYELPEGYSLTLAAGKRFVSNMAGERCQLVGSSGRPALICPDGQLLRLGKCRDITLNVVMETLLHES